uniref:Uncharacterized protein n=1 Tax=Anguilla anguilla TaxID=7936 RepID=A0A0E9U365_ANGAN
MACLRRSLISEEFILNPNLPFGPKSNNKIFKKAY